MKKLDSIAIIGVGLIGASIGLAVRRRDLAEQVIGIGRDGSLGLAKARTLGAVTTTAYDVATGVANADLVVVCTPIEAIVSHVRSAMTYMKEGALITDAGSTKASIVDQLEVVDGANVAFVGSHPMAGSHRSGPQHGDAELFVDRPVIVTPQPSSDDRAVIAIESFWQALGAKTMRMNAADHDEAVAMISHLPHAVASALAAATSVEHLPLASSGWSDTTRVASGNVSLWLQILNDNRDHVLKSLDKFGKVLTSLREALAAGEDDRLSEILQAGKETRDQVKEPS